MIGGYMRLRVRVRNSANALHHMVPHGDRQAPAVAATICRGAGEAQAAQALGRGWRNTHERGNRWPLSCIQPSVMTHEIQVADANQVADSNNEMPVAPSSQLSGNSLRWKLRAVLIAALMLIASAALIDGSRHHWRIDGEQQVPASVSAPEESF